MHLTLGLCDGHRSKGLVSPKALQMELVKVCFISQSKLCCKAAMRKNENQNYKALIMHLNVL